MNKLIKSLAVIGVALTAFSTTTTHASAKHHYVTTPTTLRGRWYSLNKAHETLNITKYTIQNGTWKLSGKKFFLKGLTDQNYILVKINLHIAIIGLAVMGLMRLLNLERLL